jgi:hypothetical protein
MLPAHEEILSIQLVTNNKYARQVPSSDVLLILEVGGRSWKSNGRGLSIGRGHWPWN